MRADQPRVSPRARSPRPRGASLNRKPDRPPAGMVRSRGLPGRAHVRVPFASPSDGGARRRESRRCRATADSRFGGRASPTRRDGSSSFSTGAAGCADAIGFLALGHVFTANMSDPSRRWHPRDSTTSDVHAEPYAFTAPGEIRTSRRLRSGRAAKHFVRSLPSGVSRPGLPCQAQTLFRLADRYGSARANAAWHAPRLRARRCRPRGGHLRAALGGVKPGRGRQRDRSLSLARFARS